MNTGTGGTGGTGKKHQLFFCFYFFSILLKFSGFLTISLTGI
jgi:hypothetical protein